MWFWVEERISSSLSHLLLRVSPGHAGRESMNSRQGLGVLWAQTPALPFDIHRKVSAALCSLSRNQRFLDTHEKCHKITCYSWKCKSNLACNTLRNKKMVILQFQAMFSQDTFLLSLIYWPLETDVLTSISFWYLALALSFWVASCAVRDSA